MTNEEMAAELRQAGWRVQEPLTQQNCKHPRMRGSSGLGCDGSSSLDVYCPDCGYAHSSKLGPKPGYDPLAMIPQN